MIRQAAASDLPQILSIYATAREFMRQNGNPTQWPDHYPSREMLLADMARKELFVIEEDTVCACFLLASGPDPTYATILDGSWASDAPYGVLHRVASNGQKKGVLHTCVAFAAQHYTYLRIDTHEDNHPMQNALLREGFTHRGTIFTDDGTGRLAYDLHI